MCEIKVIYLGRRLFVCDVILYKQQKQLNGNTDNCYVIAAFSVRSFCAPAP